MKKKTISLNLLGKPKDSLDPSKSCFFPRETIDTDIKNLELIGRLDYNTSFGSTFLLQDSSFDCSGLRLRHVQEN